MVTHTLGLPWWFSCEESICQSRRCGLDPWVGKIPWKRKWQPTPVFSPGKSHGQRRLVGYSPCDCKRVRHNLVTQQQQRESQILVDSCIWAFDSHSASLVFSFCVKWRDWTRWSWQSCCLLGAYPGHLVFPFVSFSVLSAELKEKRNKAVLGPVLYYW